MAVQGLNVAIEFSYTQFFSSLSFFPPQFITTSAPSLSFFLIQGSRKKIPLELSGKFSFKKKFFLARPLKKITFCAASITLIKSSSPCLVKGRMMSLYSFPLFLFLSLSRFFLFCISFSICLPALLSLKAVSHGCPGVECPNVQRSNKFLYSGNPLRYIYSPAHYLTQQLSYLTERKLYFSLKILFRPYFLERKNGFY